MTPSGQAISSPLLMPDHKYCTGSTEFCTLRAMLETSLYPVVKQFLEKAGYHVKGEVNGCDAVAVKDDEPQQLAMVEMKRGFNLDLRGASGSKC